MTREIVITPVLNGFICKVGCQKVVFESIPRLIVGLEEYLHNPDIVEKKYIKEAVNKMEPQLQPQVDVCDSGESPVRATYRTLRTADDTAKECSPERR